LSQKIIATLRIGKSGCVEKPGIEAAMAAVPAKTANVNCLDDRVVA